MNKSFLSILFGSLIIVSCSYFEGAKKNDSMLKIDTIVDFNTIDEFPLFPNCKNIPSREKQQICFQIEMSQHIYAALQEHQLNAKEVVNDTVMVKLKVDDLGKISLSEILISEETKALIPNFDSLVNVSIENLPKLEPAIKRNMPVTTEFILPIILTNDIIEN